MDVLMPQLGETVAEGKITKWFKSAGDAVKPGDNLFEIETDKVSMEVPSITAGMLTEIQVPAGEVAPVGAVVAVIAGEGGAAASALPQPLRPHRSRRRHKLRSLPRKREPRASDLGPRFRGDERTRTLRASRTPSSIRSSRCARPSRNFGPAKTAGRHDRDAAGAPARRRERHRSRRACRGSGPHGRIVARRCRDRRIAKGGGRAARRMATGAQRRAGQGALPGRRVRGSAARRHARDHRAPAGRGQADHPAFLSRRRRRRSTRF